jgi:peptidoglycan hydrolase-like protein with peptidoglycan-binding domain
MFPRYWRVLVALIWASTLLKAHMSGVLLVHAAQPWSPPQNAQTLSSEFIKSLQRELKRAGYDPGATDGKMVPSTRRALPRCQEAHGLAPTGDPDIPTLTKLLRQHRPPHRHKPPEPQGVARSQAE